MSSKTQDFYHTSGGRKTAKARVFMRLGKGLMTVNGRKPDDYFKRESLLRIINQPFRETGTEKKLDCKITVRGGGLSGQAGATRFALARALVQHDEEARKALRAKGFLTRDARIVERKKVGLHKARKDTQYSKR